MSEVTLTLPMPPSVNQLYTGKNRRIQPAYAAWINEAGWRVNEQRGKGNRLRLPKNTWYWTDIRLPENHLGDSDNRLKAMHDLLWKMDVTPDDKWLLGGTYMRCADVEPGTCVVTASAVEGPRMRRWEQIRLLAERMIIAEAAVT